MSEHTELTDATIDRVLSDPAWLKAMLRGVDVRLDLDEHGHPIAVPIGRLSEIQERALFRWFDLWRKETE